MADLAQALKQLRKQRDQAARTLARIDMAINALDGSGISRRRGGRRMSAAARRRIAAAQKARWAKWRAKRG